MANTKPPPDRDRLTQAETRSEGDEERGRITHPWLEWLRDLAGVADKSPQHLFTVSLEDQQASIGATDMSDGSLSAGLYRASYYARISQVATTSSSLTVTLGWTDDDFPRTHTLKIKRTTVRTWVDVDTPLRVD